MRINITLFLLLFSVLALGGAYTSQYVFGMEPCILCLYQRIPHFLVVFLSIISLFITKSLKLRLFLIAMCGLALIVGGGIAFFHVGVEAGKFSLTNGCDVGSEAVPSTIEEMTTQLLGKPHVPCDKPQFVFLGLSMAAWNFLLSGSFGFITLINVSKNYKTIGYLGMSDVYRDKK